jgi:hypothetical protein
MLNAMNDLESPKITQETAKDEVPSKPPEESFFTGLKEAWPALFAAMIYLVVGMHRVSLFGFSRPFLVDVMKVEFLVIHAGAMLTALGIVKQTEEGKRRRYLNIGFWVLLALYVIVSFATYGLFGPLIFLSATIATFWGIGRGQLKEGFMLVLLIRWFVTVILFVIAIQSQHLSKSVESWSDDYSTHLAGFIYFVFLASLEWAGFFRAPWWKKIEISSSRGKSNRG